MEKIVLSDTLIYKLNRLVDVLLDKDYFGFKDSAEGYVISIKEFINTIPDQTLVKTKNPKHGKYYVRYLVKNKRTQYYITFNMKEGRYGYKNIFTSHERGYDRYIKVNQRRTNQSTYA